MKHDPFYRQIVERLNGDIDADVFEECVVDLIRRYDNYFAVPILGGQDGGMDGAVADGEGEPFPIITTTSNRVIGNLTRNLKQYIAVDGKRRKCIVATSNTLTSRKRENLRERAYEFKFTLVQILDQSAVAARLYHDPKWCKELLQLTGKPPVLSVIPKTQRELLDHELIGREPVTDWLRNATGDKLLIGEPGAGKTSLLFQLAKDEEQGALFVVDNGGEIANAIREQQPKILMLDDVHTDKEFLRTVKHLRDSMQADFSLIVTCWNGERQEIESILNTNQENIRELDRLTQDQIVQVIAEAGIQGVSWLVQDIVEQAEGLAGLAVTLTYLALTGGVQKIRTAAALSGEILTFYVKRTDHRVREILAGFALGGNAGMHKDTIASHLGISPLDLSHTLTNLASGGIIAEVSNRTDHIKVRPDALRHALIREVFFSGAAALSQSILMRLIAATPNRKDTALVLIRTKARGANVPPNLLETYIAHLVPELWNAHQQHLSTLSSEWKKIISIPQPTWLRYEKIHNVWAEYAWLGCAEATWVIENYNGAFSLLAHPLLQYIPQKAIPMLLTEAVGDNRELHSSPDHPLRIMQDWIKSAYPTSPAAVQRRAAILQSTRRWLNEGYDSKTGYKAILFAMIPEFQTWESKPGSRNTTTLIRGCVTKEELLELQSFWKEIIECAKVVNVPDWEVFLDTFREWAYLDCSYSEESREVSKSFAREMALDLTEAASDHVGALHSLKNMTERLYPDLKIKSAEKMEILYPIHKPQDDFDKQNDCWQQDVYKLADEWAERKPKDVVAQLEHIERESNKGQMKWPRLTPNLCYRLAVQTHDPLLWLDSMLATALPADTVIPFLQEAIKREMNGWEQALRSSFETERLQGDATQIILLHENPPVDLTQAALDVAGQYSSKMELLLRFHELSQEILVELFNHPDKTLVGKLAVVEWQRKETGAIDDIIRPLWERAIIEHCEDDFWLGEILKVESELGLNWLKHKFGDDSFRPYQYKRSIENVLAGLNVEQRRDLLNFVPDGYFHSTIISGIIGNDPMLYKLLLQQSGRKKSNLLSPMHRSIDHIWMEFAKLAYQWDFAAEEIVEYTFARVEETMIWSGDYSNIWKDWSEQFKTIIDHNDPTIRYIAEVGLQISSKRYEEELRKERDEKVYGRD